MRVVSLGRSAMGHSMTMGTFPRKGLLLLLAVGVVVLLLLLPPAPGVGERPPLERREEDTSGATAAAVAEGAEKGEKNPPRRALRDSTREARAEMWGGSGGLPWGVGGGGS